jgi:hypothetical protein
MSRLSHFALTIVVILLWPALAPAETSGLLAGELRLSPDPGGNGIVIAHGRFPLGETTRLDVTLNTDTLDVAIDRISLGDDLALRVGVAGEALIAGVLTNYFRRGESVAARGFYASWLALYAELERRLGDEHFLKWHVAGRRWFFGRTGSTADALVLPAEFYALEQKLSYTWWSFRPDASTSHAHRLFWRLRGFGAGVQVESHLRSEATAWGHPDDPRNDPGQHTFIASQWAAVGIGLGDDWRLQLREETRAGFGGDDLTRRRVGGFNPYSVDLAGAPWPAFLSSHVASGHGSLHWNAWGDAEVGLLGDVVYLRDPARDGSDEFGALGGVGAFLDYRDGPWQGDLRAGWTLPSRWLASDAHLGVFAALGRSF